MTLIINAATRTKSGCLEYPGSTVNGYPRVKVNGHRTVAHRAVWMLVNGPLQPYELVLHRCDNPRCIEISHLFTGSHADNVHDCINKGRFKIGGRAKAADPYEAYLLFESGMKRRQIAARLGVSIAAIARYLREVRHKS